MTYPKECINNNCKNIIHVRKEDLVKPLQCPQCFYNKQRESMAQGREFQRDVKPKEKAKQIMYKIEKSRNKDDYDNMNYQPSDGGLYTAKDALFMLESSNGGCMIEEKTGKGYGVSYKREDNKWLREKLSL